MTHPMMRQYFNFEAQQLFNNLVEEAIQFGGIECWYVPMQVDSMDLVMNEIFLAKYKEAFKVTVFREEAGGYYPNDFFVQKFGTEFGGSNTIFAVSKSDWTKTTGEPYPTQGGLLIFPDVKQIYEIKDIDTRDPWISGGKIYSWKLSCLPFERGNSKAIHGDVLDFLDAPTSDLLDQFLDDTDVYDPFFFTADSTCITIDTTKKLASDDLSDDYFLPVTADREDVWAGDDEWMVDIEWKKIDKGNGPQKIVNIKYNDAQNGTFSDEAAKYKTTDTYGFN